MNYRRKIDDDIGIYAPLNALNLRSSDMNKMQELKNQQQKKDHVIVGEPKDRKGEIQLIAIGEASLAPNTVQIKLIISSTKVNTTDAETSTNRRLEYVLQTLHNNGIKDDHIEVSKCITRLEKSKFKMMIEIVVRFVDFRKCQMLRNFFVSKLDDNVTISQPIYHHDSAKVNNLRQQALMAAVKGAQNKAYSIANLFHGTVGQPVLIKEEHCEEWSGESNQIASEELENTSNIYQFQTAASTTKYVRVEVSACFEIKFKKKHHNRY